MQRTILAAGAAALALGLSPAWAATSVSTSQWTATADPSGGAWFDLSLQGGSVVANDGPAFGAVASDAYFQFQYSVTFAPAPGWQVVGLNLEMQVEADLASYSGPTYSTDAPRFVDFILPFDYQHYTADYAGALSYHLSGAAFSGVAEVDAHPQSVCGVPISQCLYPIDLSVGFTVLSLTITPEVVSTVPEPLAPASMGFGVAALALASRRRWA